MIDFTKIQTYDIPPKISELQNTNVALINKNNSLKKQSNIVLSILAIMIIVGFTAIYKKNNKNDEK